MRQKKNIDNLDNELCDELEELGYIEEFILEDINEDIDDVDNVDSDDEDENDDVDDSDIMFQFNTNNHKLEGKHSLTRDTIFKGKAEDNVQESEYYSSQDDNFSIDGLPIEIGSNYEFESKYHEEYIGRLNLSRDVFDLLSEKTELDFSSNRRKPNIIKCY